MNGHAKTIAMSVVAALAGACDRTQSSGPPELRLGRDECAGCGMIITDERCASAVLTESEGTRGYKLFDDIGCMLDFEHAIASNDRILDRFVHDYATGAWASADKALFLLGEADKLRTPMGSGVHAFSARTRAEEEQRRFGGEILDFGALSSARGTRTEARSGKADGRR